MKSVRLIKDPRIRLALNLTYAVGNVALGIATLSWWFTAIGAYYSVLSATRFFVFKAKRSCEDNYTSETVVRRRAGILLTVLSICIIGINILSAIKDRGRQNHTIIMITIALYTFTKITVAIVQLIRAKKDSSPILKTLRNRSFADACVSMYSLQRSMLVSFPGMESADIQLLNIFTGSMVWITVFLLGINLIGGKHIEMAKSKIAKASEKVASSVTDGYKKIEGGVVGGYKKIEQGVVRGYTKLEDKFVEAYLTNEGETVEEAKKRLKNNK